MRLHRSGNKGRLCEQVGVYWLLGNFEWSHDTLRYRYGLRRTLGPPSGFFLSLSFPFLSLLEVLCGF